MANIEAYARHIVVTKKSNGTAQLAQLLSAIIRSTNANRVAFVGLTDDGEPTEVNDYVTMYIEQFPCEGRCWKELGDPPLTEHVTIVMPSLVARVCTVFGCGSFFIVDTVDAPSVSRLPYNLQKDAAVDQAWWYKRVRQGVDLQKIVNRNRDYSRKYMREKRANKQKEGEPQLQAEENSCDLE